MMVNNMKEKALRSLSSDKRSLAEISKHIIDNIVFEGWRRKANGTLDSFRASNESTNPQIFRDIDALQSSVFFEMGTREKLIGRLRSQTGWALFRELISAKKKVLNNTDEIDRLSGKRVVHQILSDITESEYRNLKQAVPIHPKIFLCYPGSFDEDILRTIYDALVTQGAEVWMQKINGTLGGKYKPEIYDALQNCICVVALLSAKSIKKIHSWKKPLSGQADELSKVGWHPDSSKNVFNEYTRTIIPIRLEDFTFDELKVWPHCKDLFESDVRSQSKHFEEIIKEIIIKATRCRRML